MGAARANRARAGVILAALCLTLVAGMSTFGVDAVAVAAPPAGLLAPDDPATGDPPAPDGSPAPDALDQPAPVVDETVTEYPPPARPGLVQNANGLAIAWVGTPDQRPADAALVTLQTALNTVPAGGTVSFDPNDYAFTGALAVNRAVTVDSSAASTLFTRFTVSAGGLRLGGVVAIGVASSGATVSVTGSAVALDGVTVLNPNDVPRPTGIQLGAGVTGVSIGGFTMDGGGVVSSYGINLTTGSATITDVGIDGVATGIVVTASATTVGIAVDGGHIAPALSGIALGSATSPRVAGVTVSGGASTGTGIDLANSSGAVVDGVTVQGFARGIGATPTSGAAGPTITAPVISGVGREGIALGATVGSRVARAAITGSNATQSTGILVFKSVQTRIDEPLISGTMYGITTHLDNRGAGPVIAAPHITAFGGITLGSTQGASVTDAVLDAGAWGPAGTGINLVNAGRVTVSRETATGFLYAIGSQSSLLAGSDRTDISISGVWADGAPDASHGVYLLGAVNATISGVEAHLTGSALVIHQSVGVNASDIVVHGRAGPTDVTGAAILRAYGSHDVNVDRASLDAGSYGFFYSATDGATVSNASVANVVERALYGRSVANLDVSASTFTGNASVGVFVVTTDENGISHDVSIHDSTMTDNLDGIGLLQGTTGVQIQRNTATGQPGFVTAGGAHDVLIADNAVAQPADAVAISVEPLWEDGTEPGSYSSSGIRVQRNRFTGGGTWISVGSPDPAAPDAERRALRDPVLATGNVFPAESAAVRTYPNAVVGLDAAARSARALPVGGPVAVDARDYDDPNDWGSPCRPTGFLDGALYYDGGGAGVYELTRAPVLYPMNCIDLSLDETLDTDGGATRHVGDLVSWTLTPHNSGPRAAPAGWSVTQLLPDTVELVSLAGEGYTVWGTTATALEQIPNGADGPPIRVTVRIVSMPPDSATMRNVAYVAPAAPSDLDDDGYTDVTVERFSPLLVPTLATDTDVSATDNDAQGVWSVAPADSAAALIVAALADTGPLVAPVVLLAVAVLSCGVVFAVHAARAAGRGGSPRRSVRPLERARP